MASGALREVGHWQASLLTAILATAAPTLALTLQMATSDHLPSLCAGGGLVRRHVRRSGHVITAEAGPAIIRGRAVAASAGRRLSGFNGSALRAERVGLFKPFWSIT